MQVKNLQELVSKLQQGSDMQVETTTLGKFLGAHAEAASEILGGNLLERPVLVTTREGMTQLVDLTSGFVISFKSISEILPKLMDTFSAEAAAVAKPTVYAEDHSYAYKQIVSKQMSGNICEQLSELRSVMYRPGSITERLSVVEKTIKILESHKPACVNGELERVQKAQEKLAKLIVYLQSKRLAPGQAPSVYEIAIWEWLKN